MKNLKKLILFFAVGITISSVLLNTLSPLVGQAAADDQNSCTYTFANSKAQVLRSDCNNGVADATYNAIPGATAATGDQLAFQLTEKGCTSSIIQAAGSSADIVLNGQVYENGSCTAVESGTTLTIVDNTTAQQTQGTDDTAYVQTLDAKLQPLIDKYCKSGAGVPASATSACTNKWYDEIKACHDKIFATIKSTDPNADTLYLNGFSSCLQKALAATGGKVKVKEIQDAIGSTPYTDLTAAATAAEQAGDSDTTNSCEESGGFLAWIMCGLLDGLADAVGHAYTDVIQPLLKTPPIDVSNNVASSAQSQGLKKAWSSFRDIANAFLIIAVLSLVIGESIGGGRA